ncbi:MAG: glycosyltransferase family 39 protein [Elusimicrobiota bacterium]
MRRFLPSRPFLYFLGVSIAFLALALPHLESPRIGWEEAIVPSAAIELLAGRAISPHFVPLRVAGRDWPLLFNVRGTGAVESYLMLPVFKLFGASVVALRLAETLLTLLAGLLFVRAARFLFDEETAYTAAPLLLLNAAFLLYGTRDGFEGAILVQWLFLALSLLAFARVFQGRGEYLPWAALALGAGVYAKLHFLGVALGMSAAWAGLVATGRCPAPRPRVAAAAVACFALGCLPFIAWNLHSGGESFRHLGELAQAGSDPFAGRVALRLLQLRGYLCGRVDPVYPFPPGRFWLALRAAPFAALIWASAPILGGRSPKGSAALPCLAAIVAAFLLAASLMLTRPGTNHVLPALPLVLIAYASALRRLFPGRAARAAFVALLLLPDLAVARAFHSAAASAKAPDAVVETADYLRLNRIDAPLNVNDHDLGPEIEFLTGGQVIPVQAVLFSKEDAMTKLSDAVRRPSSVFLMTRGRALSDSGKARMFEEIVERSRRRLRLRHASDDGEILLFDAE